MNPNEVIDKIIDNGPSEAKPEDTSRGNPEVLPLSQSADPKVADKPFNINEFNKIKGEPEVPQKTLEKKDPTLEKEEKEALEREKAIKAQEEDKAKNEQKAASDTKKEVQLEQKKEDKLPFKPLKDITQSKTGTEQQDKIGERDFTGFDETEVNLLKKMSNEAFQFVRPRLLAEKELKGKIKELETNLTEAKKDSLPENYFEHPQAYYLDKRYQQSINNVEAVNQEMGWYEQALIKCKAGEEWIEPRWDASRNTYVGIKHPASPKAELYIEGLMHRARQIMGEEENNIKGIMQEHEVKSAKLKETVRERENTVFPQYKDPDIIKKDPVMKSLADYLSSGGLENNVLLPTCCKFYAHAMKLQDKVDELESKMGKEKAIEEVKNSNGPTNSVINTGVSSIKDVKGKDEIPFDPMAFERLKQ